MKGLVSTIAIRPHLPSEVRKWRVFRRVGYADMDDASNTGFDRRCYQDAGVLDGDLIRDRSSGKANPIGVVQSVSSPKIFHQTIKVAEVQR